MSSFLNPIKLGISSCPNDTFMFYALLKGKIHLNFEINPVLMDISKLNQLLLNRNIDVCKGSIAVYPFIMENYTLLRSGLAMGRGCGPLIISKNNREISLIKSSKIAIPGINTTANLLLKKFDPEIRDENLIEMNFADIPKAVLKGQADLGLIIHETRFTYKDMGLSCLVDLGGWWEKKTGLPLPLGGIFASKSMGNDNIQLISDKIQKSIFFSMSKPDLSSDFIKKHAQEIDENVIKNHIELYVNKYSINPNKEGETAIKMLLDIKPSQNIFIT
jgi:1,4-dihydroxy-6-naphthoate synthase